MAEINFNQIPEIQKVTYGEYEYQVDFGGTKVLFNDASKSYSHLMAVEKDDTLLRFQLPGVAPKETLITDNNIFYPEVFTNVDASYEVLEDRVKETIIIKDASALHKFDYSTLEQNINASFKDDGSIVYKDLNEKELYTLEAPYAFDANNNEVEVYMTNQISGYTLEVVKSDSIVYPIYLDPTVTMATTSTYSWFSVVNTFTPYGSTAVREIDLNTFDITSLKVSYITNTSYYCIYTFKSIDASDVATVIGTVNKTSNVVINIPAGAKKLRIEAAWANNPGTATTIADGIHLVSLTTNTKGMIRGTNSYSTNFTTITNYGTVEDSQVTNVFLLGAIGYAKSMVQYYKNSSVGKYVLRYTDDASVVHNPYIIDYSTGLLSEPIPTNKISAINCGYINNTNGTFVSNTYTAEVLFFNNKAIASSTIPVSLTIDVKRPIAKSNSFVADSKRPTCVVNHMDLDTSRTTKKLISLIADIKRTSIKNSNMLLDLNRSTTKSSTMIIDSIRPICVAASISLNTIRTTVQHIVLISDIKKIVISNVTTNTDLKRIVSISKSISIDLLRTSTITKTFNSDLYRTIYKSVSLLVDTKRKKNAAVSLTFDTLLKTAYINTTSFYLYNNEGTATPSTDTWNINKVNTGFKIKSITLQYTTTGISNTLYINGVAFKTVAGTYTYTNDSDTFNIGIKVASGTGQVRVLSMTTDRPVMISAPTSATQYASMILPHKALINKVSAIRYDSIGSYALPVTLQTGTLPYVGAKDQNISIYSTNSSDIFFMTYDILHNTSLVLDTKRQVYSHFDNKSVTLTLDLKRQIVSSKSIILDSKRSVGVQNNILIDSKRTTIKSLQLNVDTKRQTLINVSPLVDTKRITQVNNSTIFDSVRNITIPSTSSLDVFRRVLATNHTTVDTQRRMVASESNVLDIKRIIAANKNISLDTKRSTEVNTTSLIDTKRSITKINSPLLFLDTKKIVIKDTSMSIDTTRQLANSISSTFDSVRHIATNNTLTLDTKKQIVKEHVEHLAIDTKRLIVTNSSFSMDTKKVSAVTSNRTLDTLKGTSVTDGIQLDTIKVAQSKVGLGLDTIKGICKNAESIIDTKKESVLPTALNLDSSRTIAVSDQLILDTNREITLNKILSLNLDLKRRVTKDQSLVLDTVRQKVSVNNTLFYFKPTNVSTTTSTVEYFNLLQATLGFKIKEITFQVSTVLKSASWNSVVNMNGTNFIGDGTYTYTNTQNDLNITVTCPRTNSLGNTCITTVKVTSITTDKYVAIGYGASTSLSVTMPTHSVIRKAVGITQVTPPPTNAAIAVATIKSSNMAKTLPYIAAKNEVITSTFTSNYCNILFLQYEPVFDVSLILDTERKIKTSITFNDSITIDTKRIVVTNNHLSLDTIKKTIKNNSFSSDTIRISEVNDSTVLSTKRLVASESNFVLDTFREVVNKYIVSLSADTLRTVYVDVAANMDLLRKVSVDNSTILDMDRRISINNEMLLDTSRSILWKPTIYLDMNREVQKSISSSVDLNRKISINVEEFMDTLKINATKCIYIIDTLKEVIASPSLIIPTKRIVVKDVEALINTLRQTAINDELTLDTLKIIANTVNLDIDTLRTVYKSLELVFDTKRSLYIPASNLSPTLDIHYVLDDDELYEEYKEFFNTIRFLFSDEMKEVFKVEVLDDDSIECSTSEEAELNVAVECITETIKATIEDK